MSSSRFPGKVLVPFVGTPVVMHAVTRARAAVEAENVVVVTSMDAADDPLAAYLESCNVPFVRGPLEDVLARFQLALKAHPLDWLFRISADSPLLRPDLMKLMMPLAREPFDLVSNVVKRSFPVGHSLELIRAQALQSLDSRSLADDDREHVTKVFYRDVERYRILSVESRENRATVRYAIDTLEDFANMERAVREGLSFEPLDVITRDTRAGAA